MPVEIFELVVYELRCGGIPIPFSDVVGQKSFICMVCSVGTNLGEMGREVSCKIIVEIFAEEVSYFMSVSLFFRQVRFCMLN